MGSATTLRVYSSDSCEDFYAYCGGLSRNSLRTLMLGAGHASSARSAAKSYTEEGRRSTRCWPPRKPKIASSQKSAFNHRGGSPHNSRCIPQFSP